MIKMNELNRTKYFVLIALIHVAFAAGAQVIVNQVEIKEGDSLVHQSNLAKNSYFIDVGYSIGGVTSLWSSWATPGITFKIGNIYIDNLYEDKADAWHFTWFSMLETIGMTEWSQNFGFLGVGRNFLSLLNQNFAFEYSISLVPKIIVRKKYSELYLGPSLNPAIRFKYKSFYFLIDGVVSMNKGLRSHTGFVYSGLIRTGLGYSLTSQKNTRK